MQIAYVSPLFSKITNRMCDHKLNHQAGLLYAIPNSYHRPFEQNLVSYSITGNPSGQTHWDRPAQFRDICVSLVVVSSLFVELVYRSSSSG